MEEKKINIYNNQYLHLNVRLDHIYIYIKIPLKCQDVFLHVHVYTYIRYQSFCSIFLIIVGKTIFWQLNLRHFEIDVHETKNLPHFGL